MQLRVLAAARAPSALLVPLGLAERATRPTLENRASCDVTAPPKRRRAAAQPRFVRPRPRTSGACRSGRRAARRREHATRKPSRPAHPDKPPRPRHRATLRVPRSCPRCSIRRSSDTGAERSPLMTGSNGQLPERGATQRPQRGQSEDNSMTGSRLHQQESPGNP